MCILSLFDLSDITRSYFLSCLTAGQRILQYCSDVLETVVLVNPSEDTADSEVNTAGRLSLSITAASDWSQQYPVLFGISQDFSEMFWASSVCGHHNFKNWVKPESFRTLILLPEKHDQAAFLHLFAVSYSCEKPAQVQEKPAISLSSLIFLRF